MYLNTPANKFIGNGLILMTHFFENDTFIGK